MANFGFHTPHSAIEVKASCDAKPLSLSFKMAETPFPSPEELQRKIQEFMKANFGDKVSVAAFTQPETVEEEPPVQPVENFDPLEFRLTPRQVKAHLDRFVVRQEDARKTRAIAVWGHY